MRVFVTPIQGMGNAGAGEQPNSTVSLFCRSKAAGMNNLK